MAIRYAVLFGKTGVKEFRNPERAAHFAQQKANRMKQRVEIDQIRTNPRARAGEIDWTQGHYKYVTPKKNIKKRIIRRHPRYGISLPTFRW